MRILRWGRGGVGGWGVKGLSKLSPIPIPGFYETGGQKLLKLQILTAAQVLDGERPRVPFGHTESLKKASRESEDQQGRLL